MENNSSNSEDIYNNKYSNEKVKKYLQEFFEVEEVWKSEKTEMIKKELQEQTLIEKYYCEDKYVEVVRCIDKEVGYHSLTRCELALEDLGKCIFDRIKIANKKK